MRAPLSSLISVARQIEDPTTYFDGLDLPSRWQVQNLIVFLRRTADTLQARNFSDQLHYRHVLLIVLETAGYLHLDGEAVHLEPGDAILIQPYQFHHYADLESTGLSWLFMTFEVAQDHAALSALRHRVLRLPPSGWNRVQDILNEYMAGPGNRFPEILLPALDGLLGELVRLSESGSSRRRGGSRRANSWFSRVEPILRQGLDAGLSLGEIARRMGHSERYFRQQFKAAAGVSLRDYRINHQLHRAVSLMRQPGIGLNRIAELCGFQSPQAFSRFFRQTTGMTARDYRKIGFSEELATFPKIPLKRG